MNAQPAIDKNDRQYGWRCCSGKHVWIEREDAEKCCHPDWRRTLHTQTVDCPGVDAIYSHHWMHS